MGLPPPAPKAGASANFATPACILRAYTERFIKKKPDCSGSLLYDIFLMMPRAKKFLILDLLSQEIKQSLNDYIR